MITATLISLSTRTYIVIETYFLRGGEYLYNITKVRHPWPLSTNVVSHDNTTRWLPPISDCRKICHPPPTTNQQMNICALHITNINASLITVFARLNQWHHILKALIELTETWILTPTTCSDSFIPSCFGYCNCFLGRDNRMRCNDDIHDSPLFHQHP